MNAEERKIVDIVLAGANGGIDIVSPSITDPLGKGILIGTKGILALVGHLIAKHGTAKAEEILQELVANPAKAISLLDLEEDVDKALEGEGL